MVSRTQLLEEISEILESMTCGSSLVPSLSLKLLLVPFFPSPTVQGAFKVSWITDLCRPPFTELANLAKRLAREFCFRGTCINSNSAKLPFNVITYLRYEANYGSLAWYSSETCLLTSSESLFTNKFRAPNSYASSIPAFKVSYSTWLLLALNANFKDCSIIKPLGPSRMIPALLPCWLEDPSTDRIHRKFPWSGHDPSDISSTTKSAYTCPLTGPCGSYFMSNSENSTD